MSEVATYDSKKDGDENQEEFVRKWLDALRQADLEEKDWRKEGEKAIEVYRGEDKSGRAFNILHSNIETICPALYNSTPAPDVRRRFSDADPVAKVVADITERSLSFSIDNYDFDATVKAVIRDGELVGRGVPRVRYEPYFGDPVMGADGQPVMDERGQPVREVVNESVTCDYVPWKYFRRGPGRAWKDVPWIAFGDFLTKDEVRKINPKLADVINYDYSNETKDKKPGSEEGSIFKRALIWQIWDKDNRRVISICEGYGDAPIAVEPDPLELTGFFPIPRPYQPIHAPDSLTPIVPYSIYRDLANELNEITKRITRLVRQLRPRALYGGAEVLDTQALANADDGELVPATNAAAMAEGGMDKLLSWFPMDPVVKAVQSLIQQRELVKQTIYEVTGLGDILRGASQASETATAQQIKAQWGSLRVQDRQSEVARVVRDLFRIKAEIIASKFSFDTLVRMTGIVVPSEQEQQAAKMMVQQFMQAQQIAQQSGQPAPQPPPNAEAIKKAAEGPTREQVEGVLRSDILRLYRIDVESDSTIRGDLARNQQQMTAFLGGTAQFAQAMGPIVQQSPQALPIVLEIYSAFARQFKLGKQAEDALDSMADKVRQAPQQPKDDPKADMEKAKLETEKARAETEKVKTESEKVKAQTEMAKSQREHEQSSAKHGMEMEKLQTESQIVKQKNSDVLLELVPIITDSIAQIGAKIERFGAQMTAPRVTVLHRGVDGRATHATSVPEETAH